VCRGWGGGYFYFNRIMREDHSKYALLQKGKWLLGSLGACFLRQKFEKLGVNILNFGKILLQSY